MTAVLFLTALAASGALAVTATGTSRPLDRSTCKRVRDTVGAGHTMQQLTAEFDTDAAHIMKCEQSHNGKRRKTKKAAPAPADPRRKK